MMHAKKIKVLLKGIRVLCGSRGARLLVHFPLKCHITLLQCDRSGNGLPQTSFFGDRPQSVAEKNHVRPGAL